MKKFMKNKFSELLKQKCGRDFVIHGIRKVLMRLRKILKKINIIHRVPYNKSNVSENNKNFE